MLFIIFCIFGVPLIILILLSLLVGATEKCENTIQSHRMKDTSKDIEIMRKLNRYYNSRDPKYH